MILVTGGSGLVGSHLIKKLLLKQENVRAIYRTSIPEGLEKKVEWVKGDILDVVSLQEAMAGVTKVYHCAAMVSFNPAKKKLLYQINVEGTANVVNACLDAGVQKMLHVSSVAALGRIREDIPINERMKWTNETSNSEYGKTKYLAEMEVWRGIGEGLNAVIVNPVIILGAGDWNKGSSEIFKSVYHEFPWYSDGVSGFVDVLDVVNAMVICMNGTANHEKFILCAENLSYKKVFDTIAECFGKKKPSKKVTPFIAALVWRWEAVKAKFTKSEPLLTKETATTALAKVQFNNERFLFYVPIFNYTPIEQTIKRVCKELQEKYNL